MSIVEKKLISKWLACVTKRKMVFINVEDSERAATEAHARMLRNYDAWLKDLGAVLVDAIGAQITCDVDDLGRTLKEIYTMYKNRGTKPRMPKHTGREKT